MKVNEIWRRSVETLGKTFRNIIKSIKQNKTLTWSPYGLWGGQQSIGLSMDRDTTLARVGIITGNPGISQANPDPTLGQQVGVLRVGVRGFHGFYRFK